MSEFFPLHFPIVITKARGRNGVIVSSHVGNEDSASGLVYDVFAGADSAGERAWSERWRSPEAHVPLSWVTTLTSWMPQFLHSTILCTDHAGNLAAGFPKSEDVRTSIQKLLSGVEGHISACVESI